MQARPQGRPKVRRQKPHMNQLEQARAQIDTVDRQMAALFEQRMAAVRQVIEYKQATGMPILDSGREAQVIEKNTAYIAEEVLRPYYADLLRAQMALSRQYQAYVLGRDVVAHQGAEGAYSHIALTRLFPRARALSLATFDEVFDTVQDGRAAYGVIPFENSTAGDVSDVLDLLYNHSLYIVQMYDLPIRHNLLGVPGAHLRDVTDVYGHPQALRQSEAFLTKTGLATHSWPPQAPNNALAAQYVAAQKDPTKAATASAEAAALYGLEVLAEDINTDSDNTTRFIVVGKEPPVGGDRFCLLFTVDNKPGALALVIQAVAEAGFNMECIKSRPRPHVPFEYYFYIELVGAHQPDRERLMERMSSICETVRLLGTYTK